MKIFLIPLITLLATHDVHAAFNEELVIKKISDDGNSFVFVRKEGAPPWLGITIKDPQTKATLYEARVLKCSATSCMAQIVKNPSGIAFREDETYLHSYNDKAIVYDAKPVAAELKDVKPEVKPEVVPEAKPLPVAEVKPEAKPEVKPEPVVEAKPEVKPVPPVEVKPIVVAPVVKAPEEKKVEEKKVAEKKDTTPVNREGYLAYGSPVGPGITLGYLQKKENLWLGVNYGNISSTTNSVSLKGHLLSGLAMYNAFNPTPSTNLNLLFQAGLAKATLDFSGVEADDGPSVDELTYFLALGGEGRWHLGNFSLAAKMGMSKAGLEQTYDGELNQYSNPYGSILVFLEVGFYYHF
jgi:hypothetical protein